MPDPHTRINFSQATRRLVAERAGYRCSFPNCNQLTVGPSNDPNNSSKIGVAAHIYSAAVSGKGPRGTGQLSESELKSIQNAIWLCSNHASLIDKHRGDDYPVDKLHSYKTLHETRTAHEFAGLHVPFGWVDSVKISSCPLFLEEVTIKFAKLNLIIGANSVGKTGLCEWVASVSRPAYLERWSKVPRDRKRLLAKMHYYNPDPHSICVNFLSDDYPRYTLDEQPTLICTDPVKVVFPKRIYFDQEEWPDDLDLVAKSLGLHPYEVKALCANLETEDKYFHRIWFEDDDNGRFMHLEVLTKNGKESRDFRLLSGSERERLLMQLGILAASKLSNIGPTILCLDSGFWSLDTNWLKRYAEILASPVCKFQTIASTPSKNINFSELMWTGWKLIYLEDKPPNVIVSS